MTRVSRKIATLAAAEFLLVLAAVYAGTFARVGGDLSLVTHWPVLWTRALVFAIIVVLSLTAMGLYQVRQRLRVEAVLVRVMIALVFSVLAMTLVYYMVPVLAPGRGLWAFSVVFTLVFLAASRVAFARLVDQGAFRRRVVIFGAGRRASSLLQLRRRSDRRGFHIAAFVPAPNDKELIEDKRVVAADGDLVKLARKHRADEIVVAMDDRRHGFPIRALLDCKFAGVDVIDLVTFLERESGKVKVDLINPSWMIFSEGFTRRNSRSFIFRLFDLIVSATLLVIVWPVMLLVALAILIEDGLPVFYRQNRVGLAGREFELLKFRSMRRDAEAAGAPVWAQADDDRITRVGKVIRPLRLDELPQLINVLRGDMRIIGPRPERPEFVRTLAKQIPYYQERHCVKPGVTGWAQLCYPYGSSEKDALEKLQFDLYYVKNQGLMFDLMILLQTVEVVLWRKGAR